MTARQPPNFSISNSTWVNLGLVVSFIVATSMGSWHMSRIYHTQQGVLHELEEIHHTLDERTMDRWTASDMSRWVDFANREVEVWSLEAERKLDLPEGTWRRFKFPMPEIIKGG